MKKNNEFEMNNLFLIIPFPRDGEFILSYLWRIKKSNCYPRFNMLFNRIFGEKMIMKNISKQGINKKLLSTITGISEEKIESLCIDINDREYYSINCMLVCPFCIKNQDFITKEWYKKESICLIHSMPYISKCPHCKKMLSWDAKEACRCLYCNKLIYEDIEGLKIINSDKINIKDVYYIYRKIFNFKNYHPNRRETYSVKYLCDGLNKSVDFAINPEAYFVYFLRRIFIPDKFVLLDELKIKFSLYYFIYEMVYLFKYILKKEDLLKNVLGRYINIKLILFVLNIDMKIFLNYLLNCKINIEMDGDMLTLNKYQVSLLLNLDIFYIDLLCDNKLIKTTNDCVSIQSLTCFLLKISKNLNYTKPHKLNYLFKLNNKGLNKILKSKYFFSLNLYNFSYDKMLGDIMVDPHETKKYCNEDFIP